MTAPSGETEGNQPCGDPGKKCLAWGLRDQQLGVCRLGVLGRR